MVNAAQMTSETLAYATLGGLAIALLISIYTDIRYRLIFNKITIAIGAPIFWLASGGFNLTDIGLHLLTAAITFFVFAIAFHLGAMGGGDVKLFAPSPSAHTDGLFDRAENAVASIVADFDADDISILQEWRGHFARCDFFDHAHFGKTAVAASAVGDGTARPAIGIAVGHGA